MTNAQVSTAPMTINQFVAQFRRHPFELINGERISLSPVLPGHNTISRSLFIPLHLYAAQNRLGEVFYETPYVLTESSQWVKGARVPDLLFFSAERWSAYIEANPEWKAHPFTIVPDLAVEIVSPTDRYARVIEKVGVYLEDGVRLVWVIDPENRQVSMTEAGANASVTLSTGDTLTGSEVIPGFSIPVTSLFE